MIYQEITKSDFRTAFHNMGRADSWSYGGLGALYDYLMETKIAYKMLSLDVIELDCKFCEYACIDEFFESYDSEDYPDIETIRNHTTVIEVPNSSSFIIAEF
tara:strand:- start:2189 stop:2494 length:306 start_codon:yes stop_codon:yes gene_type:complete